jgi:hypothetical protein
MNSTHLTELLPQSLEHERCRELWLESLGIDAELPPAEEKRDVTSAAEAQHAKETRQPRH